ncbi:dodecin family protein [Legionella maioricensis]|uniref:Dodecin family protein n=1 Tax=Legionella maioricensis TaxID=2896528 RepID=A0A9X2IAZ4_9GAMM|nr:dodecin family protein [Legionella maioricensis]MCL9684454.1 dodecin family protein [Legionella maioricensis]MCL9688843.1 dodecin family protein [Legionella maioricensis]
MKSIEVFTGFSESGIDDAIQNALDNAGNPIHFEVIETRGSRDNDAYRQYQATLKTVTK